MNQNTNEECAINLSQRPSAATTPTDDVPNPSFLVSNQKLKMEFENISENRPNSSFASSIFEWP